MIECVEPRLIVMLDNASLEVVPVDKELQLLNCDDHIGYMKKKKREISEVRRNWYVLY